jgi:hypothetical protein
MVLTAAIDDVVRCGRDVRRPAVLRGWGRLRPSYLGTDPAEEIP